MHRMYQAVINNPLPNQLAWPKLCPSCGGNIQEPGSTQLSFAVEGISPATLPLCSVCSNKWKTRETIEKIGYSVSGIVILLAVFVPPIRQDYMYGAGGVFWLGIITSFIGKKMRESLAIRHGKSEKKGLTLWFRSKRYRDEFVSSNIAAEERSSAIIV